MDSTGTVVGADANELNESSLSFLTDSTNGMSMKEIAEKIDKLETKISAMEGAKAVTDLATSMLKIALEFGDMKKEMAELKAENRELKKKVAEFGEFKKEKEKLKEEIVALKGQNVALDEEVAKLPQTEQPNAQFPSPKATNSNMALVEENSSMQVEGASADGKIENGNGEEASILILEHLANNNMPQPLELSDQLAAGDERENEGNGSQQQDSAIEQQQEEENENEDIDLKEDEEEGSTENDEDDDDANEQMELDDEEEEEEDEQHGDFEAEEDGDDDDEDIPNGGAKGNVRRNNRRGKNTQKRASLPKIGKNFRFGNLWTFETQYKKGATLKDISEQYGLSWKNNTETRIYFRCVKSGTGSCGKCPYFGLYLKPNGYFYTSRGRHEHTQIIPEVGDNFTNRLQKTWKFVTRFSQKPSRNTFAAYGFSEIIARDNQIYMYCRRNGRKCQYAGVYLHENGCFYTRGQHEHGGRGGKQQQKYA